MNGTAQLKEPLACTERERRAFARLVRQGFAGSDASLPHRIRDARLLAFYYAADDSLAAVAALKVPKEQYRKDLFKQAEAAISPTNYELELGWVFVVPGHRGNRIAEGLCRQLLAHVPNSRFFATTRPDNDSMIRILHALGFTQTGRPYPHPRRHEELVIFHLEHTRSPSY